MTFGVHYLPPKKGITWKGNCLSDGLVKSGFDTIDGLNICWIAVVVGAF